jgi:O-antigen/teichoic acid export membrane protein
VNIGLYSRQVALLVSGAVIAQIINLATFPFLTRLYSAADFGHFAVFLSATSLLGCLASARFEVVIQACRGGMTRHAFALAQGINVVFSTVAGLAAFVLLLSTSESGGIYAAVTAAGVSVATFLFAFCASLHTLLTKSENYRVGAVAVVMRTAFTVCPQIAAAFVLGGEAGLIIGFLIGYVVQAVILLSAAHRRRLLLRPSSKRVRLVFVRYRSFVLYDFPSMFLASVNFHSLNLFILYLYTERDVGVYSIAIRLIALPLGVLSGSLSEVFFQKAARSYREQGRFWLELRFNLLVTGGLALPLFGGIIVFSGPFVPFYFGPGWEGTGAILIALAPMIALRFISSSIGPMPAVIGKPAWLLISNVGFFLAQALAVGAAMILKLSFLQFLWLNSGLACVVHIAFIVLATRTTYTRYRGEDGPARLPSAAVGG